jgi:hypothetical protein
LNIQIDSREKSRAIKKILAEFEHQGIKHYVSKLYVGDYMSLDNPRLVIDRKQNLTEVCSNVCQDHERFRAELIRASESEIKVIILVEHGNGIETLEDVIWWQNPRLKASPKAVTGERLYKILQTLERKYGCKFMFCTKEETGEKILEILSGNSK